MTVTDFSNTPFTFRYPVPPRPHHINQVDHPCPLEIPKEELVNHFDDLRISFKPFNVSRKRREDGSSLITTAAAFPPIRKTTQRTLIKTKRKSTPKFSSAISFPSEILEIIVIYSDGQTKGRLMSVS
ncbi:hypothetical protein I302_105805 [Kwoniella bestiolae CBS 10118]|uniref:Uncharacterized protein n=1 Tax=Kwoniella bestiolae CBS 10118 TaxID=1296100 RepID=A0A1B9G269_9TREE|nr:hypothetical protein I302_04926 [Kwoniella bestiolae CBS 10118]OCF25116.1 hypothetical protein I302_04926 [Kwoniella bestiolae CBS 10118]